MSTGRRASVLAVFTIFCVNILTKSDKRFIISLQVNIGIFRNTASRVISRGAQRNGVKIPDVERHCKVCMFFPTARRRGHSGKTGEGFAERTGESPRTKSGYSVPAFGLAFPSGIYVSA